MIAKPSPNRLCPDHYVELPAPDGFRIFDIVPLLHEAHPDWQGELIRIANSDAQSKIHTGDGDPTSCMQPGDQPIISYRVPATVLEEKACWFNELARGPIVDLARLAFDMPTLVAAKGTKSLYDFNIARRPLHEEELPDGEPHRDSETTRASVLSVVGFGDETVTRYALTPNSSINEGYVDVRLKAGQISFGPGHNTEHKALHHDQGYNLGASAVRITVSHGFWTAEGEGAFDYERRKMVEGLLY